MQQINRTKSPRTSPSAPVYPHAINELIKALEVRLIGNDGEQLGIKKIAEAQAIADDESLDLVEISPTAEPPVCKIMDYKKFLFEKTKEEKEKQRVQRAKQIETSEVRLRPATDENDYQTKLRQMKGFLEKGNKVKVALRLKGRELAHQDIATRMLGRVRSDLEALSVCESFPSRLEGRQMIMVLAPSKK